MGEDDVDGVGATARFHFPSGIATDGTFLYVTDTNNNKIKKIRISTAHVQTIAGDIGGGFQDGIGELAHFTQPNGIAIHSHYLYIADTENHRIRRLNLKNNEVTTIAGSGTAAHSDGVGTGANFHAPIGIVYLNDSLYVTDHNSHTIRRIDLADNSVTTIAGVPGDKGNIDAIGTNAKLTFPIAIMTDGYDLYFSDGNGIDSGRLRRLNLSNMQVTTLAGSEPGDVDTNGVGVAVEFNRIGGMSSDGIQIFLTDLHKGRAFENNELDVHYPLNGNIFHYGRRSAAITTNGSPGLSSSDRFGNADSAYSFNGSVDYFSRSASDLPAGTGSRTLCAWTKPASFPGEGSASVIASYGKLDLHQGFSIGVSTINGKNRVFVSGVDDSIGANVSLDTSKWTHICGSLHEGNAYLYINGNLLAKEPKTSWNTDASGNDFQIAARNGANLYHGAIADVRLYGRLLNDGEIRELAQDALETEVGGSFSKHPTGLVLHYPLDGIMGDSKFYDRGPNRYDLDSEEASPLISRGRDMEEYGGMRSTGGSYFRSTSNLHGLPLGKNPRTVCVWIKPERLPETDGTSYPIFEYGTQNPGELYSLRIRRDTGDDKLALDLFGSIYFTSYKLPLQTWTHLCASLDISQDLRFYANGSLVSSPIPVPGLSTESSGFIRVGYTEYPGTVYFPGKIDDVRLYNSALTEGEIRLLSLTVPTGLVARYDFLGNANDVSGFGNHLTPNNVTPSTNRFGFAGSAYSFNGVNANLTSGIPVSDRIVDYSASAWIRTTSHTSEASIFYNGSFGSNGYGLSIQAGTGILFYNQDSISVDTKVQIPRNVWTHVALKKSGTNVQVYVNGREVIGTDTGATTNPPTGGFFIGSSTAGSEYFTGEITDVQIWNKLLTQNEILAQSGFHPMQSNSWNPNFASNNLVAHFQADSLSHLNNNDPITDWLDSGGLGNHVYAPASNEPFFATNAIGNMPAVRFEEGQILERGSFSFVSSNFTFFSLQKIQDTLADDRFLFAYDADSANPLQIGPIVSGGIFGMKICGFLLGCGLPTLYFPEFSPFVSSFWRNPGLVTTYTNGHQGGGPQLFPHIFNADAVMRIGGRTSADNRFRGFISEILLFNGDLNPIGTTLPGFNSRSMVNCYLSGKYGVPLHTGAEVCP